MKITNALYALSCVLCIGAYGVDAGDQSLPSNPALLDRYQKRLQIQEPAKEPQQIGSNGAKTYVESFKAIGNTVVSHKTIDKLLEPFTKKELTIDEIKKAAFVVTQYYRDKKYFAAKAYIPKQNMQDGVLQMVILEGRYGEINVKNGSLVSDYHVAKTIDSLKKTHVVSSEQIERALLVLNDMHGLKVDSATIKEGSKNGESDFFITLKKTERIGGYAVYDNYGNDYVGKHRVGLELDVNSPGGDGDRLEIKGLVSSAALVKNYSLGYKVPIGGDGAKFGCEISSVSYKLSGEYSALDSVGESRGGGFWFSYPFVKRDGEELTAVVGAEQKAIKDEIKTLNQKVAKLAHAAYISSSYQKVLNDLEFDAALKFTAGRLYFRDEDERERDKSGANTAGLYGKANLDAKIKLKTSQNSVAALGFRMQQAAFNKNLDGGEDFAISGAGAVRAFPNGEFSAENGYVATVSYEVRPNFLGFINGSAAVFVDRGRGYMQNNTLYYHGRTLSDIGLSFSAFAYGAFFKAEVAKIVGAEKIQSEKHADVRALFQAGYEF